MTATPVISVIITCYNYGHYLAQAIASVVQQTYTTTEILVVDDGSTDNTREVAARHPQVKYIYQQNQGLSAARNTGIAQSTGEYLVFLDADDWLLPDALAINLALFRQAPTIAFCYGGYTAMYETGRELVLLPPPSDQPFLDLLAKGNFIAMIATVMFARWVFYEVTFNTALARCEDYDLYLSITRHHAVQQHHALLAAYRIHGEAMSASIPRMLASALDVLRKHGATLQAPAEKAAFQQGLTFWKTYYKTEFRILLDNSNSIAYWSAMEFFLKYAPRTGLDYTEKKMKSALKSAIKTVLPAVAVRGLRRLKPLPMLEVPLVGTVNSGDFKRLAPFCDNFGFERGGPVDRYYIEEFLAREAASIRGRVLEIGDNSYTMQYGAEAVDQSDVLHIDAASPHATFVGDLSNAPQLPTEAFDCIVLTQTLQFIYDFRAALATCYRILKPGGTLLLTVPGLSPIDKGEWQDIWYWSFTDKALARLMADLLPETDVTITTYGNVRVATAFLYGMGLGEITPEELAYQDKQYQVINAVKAVKRGTHT
jgi:glycosyltransferase involved in cell wall biosynthesis/SAM-dependent methyltransferase